MKSLGASLYYTIIDGLLNTVYHNKCFALSRNVHFYLMENIKMLLMVHVDCAIPLETFTHVEFHHQSRMIRVLGTSGHEFNLKW